ncbi:MAG: ABC transporter permease [Woeseiaceae bacterium]
MEIEVISVPRLALAFIPAALVVAIMWRWRQRWAHAVYATGRMLLQLVLVGYVLVFVFDAGSSLIIVAVLAVMIAAASWIALNTIGHSRMLLLPASFAAVLLGGGATLALITEGILQLDPWYRPNYVIPLAGMTFAQSMTAISLAIERLDAEMRKGVAFAAAREIAFKAAMIPVINSLLSVGIIFLPGMMTGQILAGVSPLVAVRYQILIMCMTFGASGLSTLLFLLLVGRVQSIRAAVERGAGA